jgi:hypothetical protein
MIYSAGVSSGFACWILIANGSKLAAACRLFGACLTAESIQAISVFLSSSVSWIVIILDYFPVVGFVNRSKL